MTEPSQKLGKGMITVAWLLALGLLTWFFNQVLEQRENPNQAPIEQYHPDGHREVILQRNYSGHYVVSGTINDESVVFFLDTGATLVSIPQKIATQLQLVRGLPMEVETANGDITVYSTVLNKVTLGPIVLHQVRASINPNSQADEILLGMSFLKPLEFTQRGDTLILRQLPDSTDFKL